jgi:hypothetical protein
MKVVDDFLSVSKFVGEDPRVFFICTFITCPLDIVRERTSSSSLVDFGVEDVCDFEF